MPFLVVNNISRQEKENLVVNNVSFEQKQFEKIAIAGSTGSGKTSVLKMVAGLIQPASGEIRFNNERVIGPLEQLIPGHKGIAYLSQHFELLNNYWVHEILEMANLLEADEAQKIYAICRVEHLLNRRTNELSGGEKQRIALARLLSTAPKLLLLDEPFSNLDAVHKNTIKQVLHDISEELKITCTMVSHDALDILSWANRIIVMKEGIIEQQGTPQEVYQKPVNEYVAGLLGDYNIVGLNGRKALVRPEHLKIETGTDGAVKAVVQKVLFFGGYYMVHAVGQGETIKIRLDKHNVDIGQPIYVSIKQKKVWYLP